MEDVVRESPELLGNVVRVGSLRGGTADRRLPARMMKRLGPRTMRKLGSTLWSSTGNVHRNQLMIPPAPRELLTVLDLTPLHVLDDGPWPGVLREQARRAIGIVASTEFIAAEIRAELGAERIWFVPPAVADRFFSGEVFEERGRPFLLHVGGASARKGLAVLSQAWPALHAALPEVELVMVGPPHPTGRNALLAQPGVRYMGVRPDREVTSLMARACAVLVPSTYEGFGMPVAEAMAVGTPVVVMAGTAPAEVGGEVAFVAPPTGGADAFAAAVLAAVGASQSRRTAGRVRACRWRVDEIRKAQVQTYVEAFTD